MKRNSNFLRSLTIATQGMILFFQEQRNAKIHLVCTAMVLCGCYLLHLSALEVAILLLTCAVVLVTECLNTALEETVNLVTQEYHPLAKKAKDIAAGAVLISSIFAVIIWLVVCYQPLVAVLRPHIL